MNQTSSAARKYITVHTIRRANLRLTIGWRDHEPSPAVRALMPSREVILKAANMALARCMERQGDRLKRYLSKLDKGAADLS
ncbi:hypothetical protein [Roseateles sp. L2-2]|uniref:hypothetical protein n=1 Tax=Roseateles sp. L2-2 TaxID=3422597 RepID=UPI003D36D996